MSATKPKSRDSKAKWRKCFEELQDIRATETRCAYAGREEFLQWRLERASAWAEAAAIVAKHGGLK